MLYEEYIQVYMNAKFLIVNGLSQFHYNKD